VRAVKTVQESYNPDGRVLQLLDQFRLMLNHCIRVGVEENLSSLKALSLKCYSQLSEYDAMSYCKLCAISSATGILRNYRKAKRKNPCAKEPYARRPRLTTCYGFKIQDGKLLLPLHAREPAPNTFKRRLGDARSGQSPLPAIDSL